MNYLSILWDIAVWALSKAPTHVRFQFDFNTSNSASTVFGY